MRLRVQAMTPSFSIVSLDHKNHYYSYLYTAAYQEIESQWMAAGYDISQNPETVTTIFNIGFGGSHPNPNPLPGGYLSLREAQHMPNGALGALFYDSNVTAYFLKS